MKNHPNTLPILLTAALGLALGAAQTQATPRTWSGGGADNYWSTAANWGGTAPAASNDTLLFDGTTRQTNTNDYSSLNVVNGGTPNRAIYFYTGGWVLDGNPVTLGGAMGNGAGTNVINAGIILTGTRTVYVDGGEIILNGVISSTGAYGLGKSGAGTLVLGGNNTYTSTTTINSGGGNLIITSPNALGTGAVSIPKTGTASGTLQLQLSGVNTVANTFNGFSSTTTTSGDAAIPCIENLSGTNTLTSNLRVTGTGGNGLSIKATGGLLILAGVMDSTQNSRQLHLNGPGNGVIAGYVQNGTATSFPIRKDGSGTWTLNGTNTFTGSTAINNGTIALGATGALVNSTPVIVAAGATFDVTAVPGGWTLASGKQLQGAGTVQGTINAAAGSTIVPGAASGPTTTVGTLVFNHDLSLNGATLAYNLSSDPSGAISPSDQIVVNGGLTATGVNTFSLGNYVNGYIPNGTYSLIKFTGALTGDASNFAVTGFTVGARGAQGGYIVANPGSIDLVVTGTPPATLSWVGDGAGNAWDINTSSNWLNGAAADIYYDYDSVTFGDGTPNLLVTIPATVKPGAVTVNSSNDYAFTDTSADISGLTGLTKLGSGTLSISNNNTYTGVTVCGGGSVSVATIGNGGATSPLGLGSQTDPAWLVLDGGALTYTGTGETVTRSWSVGSNGGTIRVSDPNATLTFTGSSSPHYAYGNTFTKDGPGTLAFLYQDKLDGTNNILGGTLKIPTVGLFGLNLTTPVFIHGGALDLNGQSLGTKPVVAGGLGDLTLGVTNGAVVNSGAGQNNALRYVTLTGNTAFGGTGRWDIRGNPDASLSTGGNAYNLIKVGGNQISFVDTTVDPALANLEIREGTLSYETGTTGLGNPAGTLTVRSYANFQMYAAANPLNKQLVVEDYATNTAASGVNTIVGPVSLPGNFFYGPSFNVAAGATLNVAGTISGAGALIKDGAGTLNLTGTNTYTGFTTVNAGKLVMSTAQASSGTITVNDGTAFGVTVAGAGQLQTDTLSLGFGGGSVVVEFSGVNSTTTAPVHGTNVYAYSPITVNVLSGNFAAGQIYPLITSENSYYSSAVLGETPPFIEATLTNIGNTLALNVTGVAATYEVWTGSTSGDWDIGTTANWLFNGNPASYTDGNAALFGDAASNTTVNVTTTVSPGGVFVNNNTKDYTFAGSDIGGASYLTKQGAASLTLSSANTYTGGTTLGGGTLNINHAAALGSGALTINLGTIDDTGSAPVTLTNAQNWNGSFAYGGNQEISLTGGVTLGGNIQVNTLGSTLTVAGAINDGGSGFGLAKTGAGSMVLAGANAYTGGTTVSAGELTVQGDQRAAAGGWAVGTNSTGGSAVIASGAKVVVPAGKLVQIGNTAGSGTTAVSLLVGGTVTNNGALLAARTSNLYITNGGSWWQTGDMEVRGIGGYSGDVRVLSNAVFTYTGPNTIKLNGADGNSGSGYLDVYGTFNTPVAFEQTTTPSTGFGEVILYGGGTLKLTAAVPSLLVNGVRLYALDGAIDTAGFDTDITGDVVGTGGLTKAGAGTLILESANNTYPGNTYITAGTLALSNAAVLVSSNIVIGGGATLDVAGLFSPLALAAGQSLGNSAPTAFLKGGADATLGSLALTCEAGSPALNVAGGSLTLDAATPVVVNNAGAPLGNGSFKLIAAGSGGSVIGTAPVAVTVAGNGLGAGGSASLNLTGGELYLNVTGATTVDTTPTNLLAAVSGSSLNLSWPVDHTGWRLEVQTNALSTGLGTNWFTWPGSTGTNAVSIPVDPANASVFYRLVYP